MKLTCFDLLKVGFLSPTAVTFRWLRLPLWGLFFGGNLRGFTGFLLFGGRTLVAGNAPERKHERVPVN